MSIVNEPLRRAVFDELTAAYDGGYGDFVVYEDYAVVTDDLYDNTDSFDDDDREEVRIYVAEWQNIKRDEIAEEAGR